MWERVLTARLVLRKPVTGDLTAVHEIHADPQTNAYNPDGPHASLEQSRELLAAILGHWSRHDFGYWTVTGTDETILGFGGLRRHDLLGEPVLNLYYRLGQHAWGHGYASEMVRATIDLLPRLDLAEPVVAIIRDTNAPSLRVAERAGLVHVETIEHGGVPSKVYRLPGQ